MFKLFEIQEIPSKGLDTFLWNDRLHLYNEDVNHNGPSLFTTDYRKEFHLLPASNNSQIGKL
jgi:hypothetical protein